MPFPVHQKFGDDSLRPENRQKRMKQLRSWQLEHAEGISESMSALARTSESETVGLGQRARTAPRVSLGLELNLATTTLTSCCPSRRGGLDDGELYLRSRGQPTDQLGKRRVELQHVERAELAARRFLASTTMATPS